MYIKDAKNRTIGDLLDRIDEVRANSVTPEVFKETWGYSLKEHVDKMMEFIRKLESGEPAAAVTAAKSTVTAETTGRSRSGQRGHNRRRHPMRPCAIGPDSVKLLQVLADKWGLERKAFVEKAVEYLEASGMEIFHDGIEIGHIIMAEKIRNNVGSPTELISREKQDNKCHRFSKKKHALLEKLKLVAMGCEKRKKHRGRDTSEKKAPGLS